MTAEQQIQQVSEQLTRLEREIRKVYVGQDALVRSALTGLIAGGNLLIEGTPGLGKTLLVRLLSQALQLQFNRIQFTPDLMPADITGGQTLLRSPDGAVELRFRPGPIFANIVLADEINRGTPKTQSALLEAMAEAAVTLAGNRRPLPQPFFVIATQNPIEMEGTYPLPEAQLDRFLFKLNVAFPSIDELTRIGVETTRGPTRDLSAVLDGAGLRNIQRLAEKIIVEPGLARRAAALVLATHPDTADSPRLIQRFVRFGASPRAMQALLRAGRAAALMAGRPHLSDKDLRAVALPVLRHRVFTRFEAEMEDIAPDELVEAAVQSVGL
ncbi:MAG: AAA family ATPase [Myxococcota bacterium]